MERVLDPHTAGRTESLGRCHRGERLSSNPLVVLAREDARLFQLKQQIAALPRRIAELDAERARVLRQMAEADARCDQAESARRRLEMDLA